ncbi:MAG: NAD(P)-dependent oxidoreductase [Alphaproteobacteria bacterium]
MSAIAFLGLGAMGAGMAARLLAAGHSVNVYNRTPGRAAPLVAAGARLAPTPRDAATGAAAIFSMVADDDASRCLWLGPNGALAGAAPGGLAIECSTLSHGWVGDLAGHAAQAGLSYIDTPVTGLPDDAAAGNLTMLVGAAGPDLEAATPLLQAISRAIVHFGPVGAGTSFKLVINLMGAVQIAAAAEGLALAQKAGLNLPQVLETLVTGQAASPQVVRNATRMVAGDHRENVVFAGALRAKDAAYGVRLANDLGVRVGLGEVAARHFAALTRQGFGAQNESKIFDILRG